MFVHKESMHRCDRKPFQSSQPRNNIKGINFFNKINYKQPNQIIFPFLKIITRISLEFAQRCGLYNYVCHKQHMIQNNQLSKYQ
jgi:hypothetical protein